MWGNWHGWSISTLIALLVAGSLFIIARGGGSISSPTDFSLSDANLAEAALPVAPRTVLQSSDSCDAGTLYRQALDLYRQDPELYERFARKGTLNSADAAKLAAIAPLLGASTCAKINLFAAQPQEVITYSSQKPALESLVLLGSGCINRLGLLHQKSGNSSEAARHFQASFALGANLYRERLCWPEMEAGLRLMAEAATALAKLADDTGDTERAKLLRAFDEARIQYVKERIEPMLRVLRTVDPRQVAVHAGDLFELADKSRERMWRVETILALGRLRYFAGADGRAANQRLAMMTLKRLADDSDPVIRAAAVAARDLTIEDYRMQ